MTIRTHIAVIGVGNDFRRADGVGWAVIDLLRERAAVRPLPAGTTCQDVEAEVTRHLDAAARS
ncbi:hypothetical protein ACIQ9Q_05575 [Streptomyces sp. NPDC094438]|uniref:hypothetical protein n=1 Tax=Streptomyces sp. NPDC094438 TaxID=3366061 RepID=UPI003826336D